MRVFELRFEGSGFKVQGSGFRVQGFEWRGWRGEGTGRGFRVER